MKINDNHLDYVEFVKEEIKTFNILASSPRLAKIAPELTRDCSSYFSISKRLLQINKKLNSSHYGINFGSKFNLTIQGHTHTVYLEVNIKVDFSECNYSVSICDREGTLVRKIHLDYAPNVKPEAKQPLYHIQVAGEDTPLITKHNIDSQYIHSYLSVPRVEITPINLAIFVDSIFCELNSIDSYPFIESPQWRQVVKSNEDLILRPYYENIHAFFQRHKVDCLHRDFRYGTSQ